jgi:predicted nucleic acid-binding protein
VDTNVLVHARISQAPLQHAAVTKLDDLDVAGHPLGISRQVLREYLAALSTPGVAATPLSATTLVADVQGFAKRFLVAEDSAAVFSQLLTVLAAVPCGGMQVHDANIVATMLARGIPKLLTHHVADFSRFAAYITLIPLVP